MFDPAIDRDAEAIYREMDLLMLVDLLRAFQMDRERAAHDGRLVTQRFCDERLQLITRVLGERLQLITQVLGERAQAGYALGQDERGASITCLACGRTSYNANDVAQRYCGNCHVFHGELRRSGSLK